MGLIQDPRLLRGLEERVQLAADKLRLPEAVPAAGAGLRRADSTGRCNIQILKHT